MNLKELDISRHKFLGEIDCPTLNWDEIIFNLNKNITNENIVKVLDNFGFVTHDIGDNHKVQNVSEIIQKLFPNNYISPHLYVSFSEISKTFGKHKDYQHVFFWQCIGITKWTVYEDKEYIYNLMPGEVLYIPRGIYHNTQPITPRAGISFGIEFDD